MQRVHGGALARSTVPRSYEARQVEAVAGKVATAQAAATLLERDQVVILDGGSTALRLVDAIPAEHTGTFITHSPPVADASARRGGLEVVVIGGSLEPRAMVARRSPDVERVPRRHRRHLLPRRVERARRARDQQRLLRGGGGAPRAGRAGRPRRRPGVARETRNGRAVAVAPATALTHIATEPGVPAEVLAPYVELGVAIVAA